MALSRIPASPGLVSHNDVYPANLVFRGGRAAALIDFDLAGPGSAVWDFAAAARSLVPLQDEADVTDSRAGRALDRFRILLDASGLPRAERLEVAEALVANHDWTYAIVAEAAAAGHAGFAETGTRSPRQPRGRVTGACATAARCWPRRPGHHDRGSPAADIATYDPRSWQDQAGAAVRRMTGSCLSVLLA